MSAARDQIQRRLTEIFDAAERKDFERLDRYHLYGPQFTKFAAEVPDRQGAQASRDGEHVGLGRVEGLVMRAKDLQIDVFSETGVATFVLDYSFRVGANVVPKQVRCTMVFVRDHGEWRIAHEHLSALPTAP